MISLKLIPQDTLDQYIATLDQARAWSLFTGKRGGILGAHLVEARKVEAYGDDLRICTVRISNGAVLPSDNRNQASFCGKVYFRDMWIEANAGWTIEPDARCAMNANRMQLVKPGAHVFLPAKQFIRRFALRRNKVTAAQAHAEMDRVDARRALSARNDWGPQRARLPMIDLKRQEAESAVKLKRLRTALATGRGDTGVDLRGDALGLQHSPGGSTAYEQGGQGIYFAPLGQCTSALLFDRTMADLWQERMATACYHRETGARITSEMWAHGAKLPYQPFETQLHGDEETQDNYAENPFPHFPPAINPTRAWNGGSCAYEGAQVEIDSVDIAHETRVTLQAKNAAWCLGDQAAIDWLCDLTHHIRQADCDIGPQPTKYSRSLRAKLMGAKADPGKGFPSCGRDHAWICDAAATGIALGRTPAEVATFKAYGMKRMELDLLVRTPAGSSQRCIEGRGDAPSIWDSFGMPRDQDAARVFELMMAIKTPLVLMRRLELLPQIVPGAADRIDALPNRKLAAIVRCAKSVLDNPQLPPGPYDNGKQFGPPNCVAVAPQDGAPYAKLLIGRGADPAHVEPALIELSRATGEQRWLDLLMVYGVPAPSLKAKRAWYEKAINGDVQGVQDREMLVEALGVLQQVVA